MRLLPAVAANRENTVGVVPKLLIHLFFGAFSLACIIPLVLVLIVSLSSEASILEHGYLFWPEQWSLGSYRYLFKDSSTILHAYGVSIGITLAGALLSVLVMALFAYPLSRRDLPYRVTFSFLLVFVMLFNGGTPSRYLVYTQVLGLRDSYLALLLPLLMMPFYVIVLRTFFQTTIHPAILESAKIDGAGEFRIIARIILPLSLPVLATVGLFSTISYWNDWFNALLYINDPNKLPLQYLMIKVMNDAQFIKERMNEVSQAALLQKNLPGETLRMAMVTVGIGPIVLAYPFFQRYFIQGLTVGSVKG